MLSRLSDGGLSLFLSVHVKRRSNEETREMMCHTSRSQLYSVVRMEVDIESERSKLEGHFVILPNDY